jgi:hypothetical protein
MKALFCLYIKEARFVLLQTPPLAHALLSLHRSSFQFDLSPPISILERFSLKLDILSLIPFQTRGPALITSVSSISRFFTSFSQTSIDSLVMAGVIAAPVMKTCRFGCRACMTTPRLWGIVYEGLRHTLEI